MSVSTTGDDDAAAAGGVQYSPARLFISESAPAARPTVLVLLHQQILAATAFRRAWDRAAWRVVADGGADRLLEFERGLDGLRVDSSDDDGVGGDVAGEQGARFTPDLVVGDLDSITPFATSHYLRQGVLFARDPGVEDTDLGKAMTGARALRRLPGRASLKSLQHAQEVVSWFDIAPALEQHRDARADDVTAQPTDVLLFGSLGGRVDQGLGVLKEMAREHLLSSAWRVYLVTERSVSFILDGPPPSAAAQQSTATKARYVLHLDQSIFSQNCGILPIFGPAVITLRGFEWDVEDWPTDMAGQVSTSQHVTAPGGVVSVETTARVLFTIEFAAELRN